MMTFREFLLQETDDDDDLRSQIDQRAYLNTERPGGKFNLGKSVGKNVRRAGVGAALDTVADMVPGGSLVKNVGAAAVGVGQDYLSDRESQVASQKIMAKYRLTPAAMHIDPQIGELLSDKTKQQVQSLINSEDTANEFLKKYQKIPFDYANQVAMKYVVQKFQKIRGPKK